jgi:tripartite-type tricarboxylate transporter receptor subunit TctC
VRGLAVAARRRLAARPQLPTLVEAGGPDVVMQPWAALVGVAGTPPAVLDVLQRDIGAVLVSSEVRNRAEQTGFEMTPSTAQALRDRIAEDTALYAPLVEEGRIARL